MNEILIVITGVILISICGTWRVSCFSVKKKKKKKKKKKSDIYVIRLRSPSTLQFVTVADCNIEHRPFYLAGHREKTSENEKVELCLHENPF